MNHVGAALGLAQDNGAARQGRREAVVLVQRGGRAAGHGNQFTGSVDDQQASVRQGFRPGNVVVDRRQIAARQRPTYVMREQPRLIGQVEHDPVVQATAHRIGGVQRRSCHPEQGQTGVRRRQTAAQGAQRVPPHSLAVCSSARR